MTRSFEIENKTGVASRGSLPKAALRDVRQLSRKAAKSGWLLGGALLIQRGEALAQDASADVAAAAVLDSGVPAAAVPAVPLDGGEAGDLSALACSVEDGPIALCDEGALEGFASDELVAVLGDSVLVEDAPVLGQAEASSMIFENVSSVGVLALVGGGSAGAAVLLDDGSSGGGGGGTAEPTNTAPTSAGAIPNQRLNGSSAFVFDISDFFTDEDDDTLTFTHEIQKDGVTVQPGNIALSETGVFSGSISDGDDAGVYDITVTASDGEAIVTQNFRLINKWDNADPTIVATIADQTLNEDAPFTLDLSSYFADADLNDTLSFSHEIRQGDVVLPGLGFISLHSNGMFSGSVSDGAQAGDYNIVVTANDGTSVARQSFNLTVNPVNDAPTPRGMVGDQTWREGDTITPITFSEYFLDEETPAQNLGYSSSVSGPDGNLLPGGVSFASGVLSGTISPTAKSGIYTIAVTATDEGLPGASKSAVQSFKVNVIAVPPTVAVSGQPQAAEPLFHDEQHTLTLTFLEAVSGLEADDLILIEQTGDASPGSSYRLAANNPTTDGDPAFNPDFEIVSLTQVANSNAYELVIGNAPTARKSDFTPDLTLKFKDDHGVTDASGTALAVNENGYDLGEYRSDVFVKYSGTPQEAGDDLTLTSSVQVVFEIADAGFVLRDSLGNISSGVDDLTEHFEISGENSAKFEVRNALYVDGSDSDTGVSRVQLDLFLAANHGLTGDISTRLTVATKATSDLSVTVSDVDGVSDGAYDFDVAREIDIAVDIA